TRYRDELQGFVRRKCRRQSPRSLRRFQSGAGALPERRVSLDDEPIKRAPTRKRSRKAALRQSAAMQPGEKTPELRCIETLERRATGKRAQRRNVAQVRRARARRQEREGSEPVRALEALARFKRRVRSTVRRDQAGRVIAQLLGCGGELGKIGLLGHPAPQAHGDFRYVKIVLQAVVEHAQR